MKRILAIMLATVMLLATVGCGAGTSSASSAPATSGAGASSPSAPANLDFPKSPITIVVPWAAGGTSDGQIRAIADLAPKYFGVPVTVVNRDGAGGTIATTEFMTKKADGYTICLEAVGVFTTQPFMREVKYSIDDFRPVIGTTNEPIVMVASKQSGIKSAEDMKTLGRPVNFGFSGAGSLPELSQKQFFQASGIASNAVPFDGGAPTITALLGGHIDVGAAHPGEVSQYLETGDLVPIGIFSPERDSREKYKDIPTFKEQGYDIDMSVWKFLIIPKDTPDDVASYLTETLGSLMKDEKFIEYCDSNSLVITNYSPEEILAKITEEAAVNKALLK